MQQSASDTHRPFRDLPSFMDYVRAGIQRKKLDEEDAARLVGGGDARVGRFILNGSIKCPLERAPAISRAFDEDPRRGLVIALNDYLPEVAALLAAEFGGVFDQFESRVLLQFPARKQQ
ncbi:MAG: hypothetical protein JJU06_16730 [Ectothiorhodospiraceae bacterium]|nr:hypothetical protein [Ectothiorhodospiraceae bacterium]MCH8503815.1 hypothetical protein [Ectothiorhodospiraceae bacterium]